MEVDFILLPSGRKLCTTQGIRLSPKLSYIKELEESSLRSEFTFVELKPRGFRCFHINDKL